MFTKIFQAVRRLLYNMGIVSGAKSVFKNKSVPEYESFYNGFIDVWKLIYKGSPTWRMVEKSGLNPTGKRARDVLNTAKVLCNELAMLTFSEQVDITVSVEVYDKYVKKVLQDNGFWKNFPDLIELMYAIGGCEIKVYLDSGNIKLDYVDGDMFIPTSWDNRRIHDGIFVSKIVKGKKFYTLYEWQYKESVTDENDNPIVRITIENHLFSSNKKDDVGIEVSLSELYPTLAPVTYINNVTDALFTYIRPAVANNIDTDSPLGISVYANALDTLKALDIAFDSFNREFILGRKRIIVPITAIRSVNDPETGNQVKYFDANDEVYQAMKGENQEELKITDNTMVLRIDDHVKAINALLNILCFQTGLSAGSFSFDSAQGLKTATEVISQNSKTYRTKQAHQNLLKEAIEDTVKSIITLGIVLGDIQQVKEYEVTIGFDDSIIVDENAIIDNNIKLVGAGLKSKLKAIMQLQKCDEATARKELEQIKAEGQVTGDEADMFGQDTENEEDTEEGEGDE